MTDYTHEFGSLFPDSIIEPVGFLDATADIYEHIKEIKRLQSEGNYVAIGEYVSGVPDLNKYVLDASVINKIEEELRNVEIFTKTNKQQIFYQNTMPSVVSQNDVWIGV